MRHSGWMAASIRRADVDDLGDLVDMERAASIAALGHVFAGIPFPTDDVAARWALVLADPSATVLVDDAAGVLVGYAAYGGGWLHHLGVIPRWWGSGHGEALHDAAISASAAAGRPTTCLWVLAENHRARRFYRRLGWRDTDIREPASFAPYPVRMQMSRPPDVAASS
ncbi:MAG: hypothetical protein AVDCRST_MAG21-1616 [uncultured Nocardioidaceae bacterium]|uniref:N-acetyltransferase domain-containing protein n=1 Tax=uncultured Nocardioidaceae bacterium TaxID=253824 RepID=A0A6J4N5T0_9ACTN|nr:MAG: hypothetical protein AVDCRST_MAG21-1616 [uncultured Nocardioidaceae bacterium]